MSEHMSIVVIITFSSNKCSVYPAQIQRLARAFAVRIYKEWTYMNDPDQHSEL